jgi:hypothetical protein
MAHRRADHNSAEVTRLRKELGQERRRVRRLRTETARLRSHLQDLLDEMSVEGPIRRADIIKLADEVFESTPNWGWGRNGWFGSDVWTTDEEAPSPRREAEAERSEEESDGMVEDKVGTPGAENVGTTASSPGGPREATWTPEATPRLDEHARSGDDGEDAPGALSEPVPQERGTSERALGDGVPQRAVTPTAVVEMDVDAPSSAGPREESGAEEPRAPTPVAEPVVVAAEASQPVASGSRNWPGLGIGDRYRLIRPTERTDETETEGKPRVKEEETEAQLASRVSSIVVPAIEDLHISRVQLRDANGVPMVDSAGNPVTGEVIELDSD